MRVRPAAPTDVDALAALSGQLGYPSSPAEVEARLHLLTTHPDLHAIYVAEADGVVVGWVHVFVVARLESDAFAELGGLVVYERQRGGGVGDALVQAAEGWARGRGLDRLRVRSNVVRERAHRFYERQGFERIKMQAVFQKRLG